LPRTFPNVAPRPTQIGRAHRVFGGSQRQSIIVYIICGEVKIYLDKFRMDSHRVCC
jgi:hypothetical protein